MCAKAEMQVKNYSRFKVSTLNGPKGDFSLIFTEYRSLRLFIGNGAIYIKYLTV